MKTPAPHPFYFGPPGKGLFAWLHRPAALASSSLGLVICNPFGFEEVCAHRSLRHVAARAAESGVPTLRFDYAGCGNSEGDEFGPQRLANWTRSVHDAIDALKAATGVTQICLLGVRLGATLATLAAVERDDIEGLIVIAPVVRGRSYLRELKILGQAGASASSAEQGGESGLLESAGFVLTPETSAALAEIDLRMLPRRPAPRVVVVERDDMPSIAKWLPELDRLGAQVQQAEWAGYAAMMRDPQRAQVPQQIVDGVAACLKAWQTTEVPPAVPAERQVGSDRQKLVVDGMPSVVETAVHIDVGDARMFGILAEAEGGNSQQAVLMLNSGSVHHIGPNRLWVRLARQWAARGVTVLRVDISGIADSPPRPGASENIVYSPCATSDIAAALAYLRDRGAQQCHALGLCSGGYHALKAAMARQGLASAMVINPLTYHWTQGMAMEDVKDYEIAGLAAKYRSRLFAGATWKKLLRGDVDVRVVVNVARRRVASTLQAHLLELARLLHVPFRYDLARELTRAVETGTRLSFIFAANAPGFDLLQRQGGRTIHRLVKRHQATLDFVAHADHTFTRLDAREDLVALLESRMLGNTRP